MTRLRYVVSPNKGAWVVNSGGSRLGDFPTQAAARDWARGKARQDLAGGQDAQVVVHGRDGRIKEERTYGHDPRRHRG
jgi:hypothetical protein